MTTYSGIIVSTEVVFTDLATLTVSGTVLVSGSPVYRTVVGYIYPKLNEPYFTQSDKTTGAFSLTLSCGSNTRLIIMALGEEGEETKVFDWVTRP